MLHVVCDQSNKDIKWNESITAKYDAALFACVKTCLKLSDTYYWVTL